MTPRLFVLLLGVGASACGTARYSDENIHRTVARQGAGVWGVMFERHKVIDDYGPGVAEVRRAVQSADNFEQVSLIWKQAVAEALPKYLVARKLVPEECEHGIRVLRSGSGEGGGGWAHFECRRPSAQ
jgi:hypothetical protein